jgi:adenylate cyclase
MRDYIARLSACVTARSGEVLDPQGDGFVCVWRCSGPTTSTRLEACLAALDLLDAADLFDRDAAGGIRLPTRVAATMGMVTLHSDGDRGTFQAYGDPLNLVARLRDLNKQFGTRFIASADVVEGLEDVLVLRRLIGDYVLKGFTRAPAIFEVRRVAVAVGPQTDVAEHR